MFKYIASLILVIAFALSATSYVNNLMTQYNELNSVEKAFTQVWCESDVFDKGVQDRIDCFIVETF